MGMVGRPGVAMAARATTGRAAPAAGQADAEPDAGRGDELTIREGEVVERAVPGDEHDEAQDRDLGCVSPAGGGEEKPGQHHRREAGEVGTRLERSGAR